MSGPIIRPILGLGTERVCSFLCRSFFCRIRSAGNCCCKPSFFAHLHNSFSQIRRCLDFQHNFSQLQRRFHSVRTLAVVGANVVKQCAAFCKVHASTLCAKTCFAPALLITGTLGCPRTTREAGPPFRTPSAPPQPAPKRHYTTWRQKHACFVRKIRSIRFGL